MNFLIKIILFLFPTIIYSQGMIVNELSNGQNGAKEYIELVVIGSSSNPLGNVNLEGWIIDDNNGDFEAIASSVGIAVDHSRIKMGCLTSVKPGSIILIYNEDDQNTLIPTNLSDSTDSNNDCIYIFKSINSCLEYCPGTPSTSSNSYICSVSYTSGNWTAIGFANSGDAPQVRKPDGSFFHGFSYGDVLSPFPTFQSGGSSFNVATGSGTGRNYFFNCGSFTNATNFRRGTAGINETPGAANNDANRYFINAVRNGTYNYSNLSDPLNCGTSATLAACMTVLKIEIKKFIATKLNDDVLLNWEIEDISNVLDFEIEKSSNGYEFIKLINIQPTQSNLYSTIDENPYNENYYRLKIIEMNGDVTYSNINNINFIKNDNITIYPNPFSDILNISSNYKIDKISIINEIGQIIFIENNPKNTISLDIPSGIYIIQLQIDDNITNKKIVKMN